MSAHRPRLLVLGSGWASSKLLDAIDTRAWDITVVSPAAYFTYTPLLASVAVGRLSTRSIVDPVRRRDRPTVTHLSAKAEGIDFARSTVRCRPEIAPPWLEPQRTESTTHTSRDHPEFDVSFDRLVIAVGCEVATFNTEGVAENAVFFKDIKDASRVRNRLLECLDVASLPHISEQQRKDLLHFVVVGDIANTILPGFDGALQESALEHFDSKGIKFEGEQHITKVSPGKLTTKELGDGIAPTPLLKGLKGVKQDEKTHNFIVDEQLHVQQEDGTAMPNVYAIGDLSTPESGKLPPVGVVADQQGSFVAHLLEAERLGKPAHATFEFKPDRKVANLSANATASEKGSESKIEGAAAWTLWRVKYGQTLSYKKRVLIFVYGIITRAFGRDLTRI